MNQAQTVQIPEDQSLIASVMLAEIAGYEDRPVFEQIDLTSRLRQLFEGAVADLGCSGVQIIDREDSIALLFPGDPRDCLDLATRLAVILAADQRYSNLPLRVGVNLGPVRLGRNDLCQIQLSGAGIDDAERVARAASLREILMSRSFYTVLSRTTMDDRLLRHKAFISDERDQSFAVYQLALSDTLITKPEMQSASLPVALPYAARRTRALWSGIAATALLAAASFAVFRAQTPDAMQHAQAPLAPVKIVVAAQPIVPPANAAIVATEPNPTPVIAAEPTIAAENLIGALTLQPAVEEKSLSVAAGALEFTRKIPLVRPVIVQLAIKPWGEVYVDGKKVGVTPPLHKIAVPPGKRQIVVRNADFLPFETTLDIQPESLLQISHRFGK
jgi:hypothetical protein